MKLVLVPQDLSALPLEITAVSLKLAAVSLDQVALQQIPAASAVLTPRPTAVTPA